MHIYLPIAETSINMFVLIGLGGLVGFLSGMLGIGGGFLMTPLLIFIGIPPGVAVASEANQLVASAVSGSLAWRRQRAVDVTMALVLAGGGLAGSALGVWLFALLAAAGQLELVIALGYALLLGSIGTIMLVESARALRLAHGGQELRVRRPGRHSWLHGLPLRIRFRASRLYASVLPPIVIGFVVGLLAALMGTGGGFIMLPAMIYLLRMPTNVVIGTSLFQLLIVTMAVTLLHAGINHTVDVMLALFLMLGGALGAQLGARAGQRMPSAWLRALLSLLILAMALRLGSALMMTPDAPFSIRMGETP